MSDGSFEVRASARMEELISEQARVRKETEQMARAFGVARSEVRRARRELDRQEAQARRTAAANLRLGSEIARLTHEAHRARRASRLMSRDMSNLRQVSANVLGDTVNDFADFGELLGMMGPGSLLVGGVVISMAAIAAGVFKASEAMVALTWKSGELLRKLDDLPESMRPVVHLTEQEEDAARGLDSTYGRLASTLEVSVINVFGRLAPAMGAVLEIATESVEQFNAWWPEIRRASDEFVRFHKEIVKLSGPSMAQSVDQIERMVGIMNRRAGARNAAADAIRESAEAAKGAKRIMQGYADTAAQISLDDETADEERERAEMRAEGMAKEAAARAKANAEYKRQQELLREALDISDLNYERELDRAKQREAGAKLERQRAEEAVQAERRAAEQASRLAAQRRTEREREAMELAALARMNEEAAAQGIDSVRQLVMETTGTSDGVIGAVLNQATAYKALALARAWAQGPFVGFAASAAALASIVPAIQEARRNRQQSHMGSQPLQGSGAPDEAMVRVRNGQRITSSHDRRREDGGGGATYLVVGNRMFEAARQQSDRQRSLFGDRRRRAQPVGGL